MAGAGALGYVEAVNDPSSNAPDVSDAQALCSSCGLCCDGTLYGGVVVLESESARLERVGLPVVRSEGALMLPQPCRALRGCLCSVYPDRPSSCARYECALRKEVSAGAQSLADALDAVARVRSLLSTVRADLGIDPEASIWASIVSLDAPKTEDEERRWALQHEGALRAVAQLLELVRGVFDARFGGGEGGPGRCR